MRSRTRWFLFAAAFVGALVPALQVSRAGDGLDGLEAGPGFAVVELFTSQGCSSCPPADRVLARLSAVAEAKDLSIYPLSMHVDYWNRLGWKDPFSDRRFSERQQSYAHALGTGAFTPQVIVNGTDETVGSREADLAGHIARHLAEKPKSTVILDVTREGDELRVVPTVVNAPDDATRWVALTRRTSENHVPRGENEGRDLQHTHVVFALENVPDGKTATFALPRELAGERVWVTAFVQDPRTMQVLGAARASAG